MPPVTPRLIFVNYIWVSRLQFCQRPVCTEHGQCVRVVGQ